MWCQSVCREQYSKLVACCFRVFNQCRAESQVSRICCKCISATSSKVSYVAVDNAPSVKWGDCRPCIHMITFSLFGLPTQYALVPSFKITISGTEPAFFAYAGYTESRGVVMNLRLISISTSHKQSASLLVLVDCDTVEQCSASSQLYMAGQRRGAGLSTKW